MSFTSTQLYNINTKLRILLENKQTLENLLEELTYNNTLRELENGLITKEEVKESPLYKKRRKISVNQK